MADSVQPVAYLWLSNPIIGLVARLVMTTLQIILSALLAADSKATSCDNG